jgi:4-diphosphocytidyl-2-C-methyl-D-erythritol kinase
MASISLRAFAKINLGLRICDARADGFHDIQTIFQAIDLHDRIAFDTRRGPFEIRCNTPEVPIDRTNLVWQAAQHLWEAADRDGEPNGVVVALDKRIPVRAGLGGGSSDAAATLLGLSRLWKVRIEPHELHAIAAKLGSDVPYFLVGGTALGLGRGEEVYPLADFPRLWVVLALAPFGVATKDAYAWWDQHTNKAVRPHFKRVSAPFPAWFNAVSPGNDFEGPVFDRHPVLGELKAHLDAAGAVVAAMSGSGSTVFAVFASAAAAKSAARKLTRWAALRSLDVHACVTRFRPRPRR